MADTLNHAIRVGEFVTLSAIWFFTATPNVIAAASRKPQAQVQLS